MAPAGEEEQRARESVQRVEVFRAGRRERRAEKGGRRQRRPHHRPGANEERAHGHRRAEREEHGEHPAPLRAAWNGILRVVAERRSAQCRGQERRYFQERGDEHQQQTANRDRPRDAQPAPPLTGACVGHERESHAHQQEEAGRTEVSHEARQKRQRARIARPGAGPHLLGVEPPDHQPDVVEGHQHHDQAAQHVDGLQPVRRVVMQGSRWFRPYSSKISESRSVSPGKQRRFERVVTFERELGDAREMSVGGSIHLDLVELRVDHPVLAHTEALVQPTLDGLVALAGAG